MPSIEVFLRFVHRDGQGNIDASRVVSRECFEEWLRNKGGYIPRDPEEAFRKALVGHCKGAYSMKPFEPEVEAALLLVLRSLQVWPCFAKSRRKIGRLGTRVRGYWESKNSRTINGRPLRSVHKPVTSSKNSRKPERSRYQNNPHRWEKEKNAIELTFSQKPAVKKKNQKISRNEIEHLQSVWKTVKNVFGQQDDSKMPLWFLHLYRQTGFSGPASLRNPRWKLPFGNDSIFYCREFSLLASHEQQFVFGRPTGKYMTDATTLSVVDEDCGARTIFQGSVDGRSLLDLWATPVHYMQHFHEVRHILYSTKEIWARSLQRRNDGSIIVLLTRSTIITGCSTCALTELQDVTDQFLQYL